jgi:TonB family protein
MKRMKLTLKMIVALLTFALGVATAACLAYCQPTQIQTVSESSPSQAKEESQKVEGEDTGCLDPNLPKPKIIVHFSVLNSKAIELPKPEYPAEAKAANVSGEVKVMIVVDEDGKVAWARIHSGHYLLQPAVKKVVCRARFKPIKVGGHPVKVDGILTYKFVLP